MSIEQGEQDVQQGGSLGMMRLRERLLTPEDREAFRNHIEEGLRDYWVVVRREGSAQQRPEFELPPEDELPRIY